MKTNIKNNAYDLEQAIIFRGKLSFLQLQCQIENFFD